jgi:pimeloyl-ACP methyl ester carboxylesterase
VKDTGGLPGVAEAFQAAGITALLFEPGSIGDSDGDPRNDIDPFRQMSDYSDAFTYLSTLSNVDPQKVGLWGYSLSASVALSTAAFDKRAKFVIAVCAVAEYHFDKAKMDKVLRLCFKDRESQVKGNPPFYIPMIDKSGENPAGIDFGLDPVRASRWATEAANLVAGHDIKTTVQSYHKISMWHPSTMWKHVDLTPILFLVPEEDNVCPPELQLKAFEEFKGPKKCHRQAGTNHMNFFEGRDISGLMALQAQFVRDALGGKLPNGQAKVDP